MNETTKNIYTPTARPDLLGRHIECTRGELARLIATAGALDHFLKCRDLEVTKKKLGELKADLTEVSLRVRRTVETGKRLADQRAERVADAEHHLGVIEREIGRAVVEGAHPDSIANLRRRREAAVAEVEAARSWTQTTALPHEEPTEQREPF